LKNLPVPVSKSGRDCLVRSASYPGKEELDRSLASNFPGWLTSLRSRSQQITWFGYPFPNDHETKIGWAKGLVTKRFQSFQSFQSFRFPVMVHSG